MDPIDYILIFILFSLIGWMIDTLYRSVAAGKYSTETKYIFNPAYGFGAGVLSGVYSVGSISVPLKILVGGILLTPVEFVFGAFYLQVLGRRLWDYSDRKWNFMGHINALHSFYWILLAITYWYLGKVFTLY